MDLVASILIENLHEKSRKITPSQWAKNNTWMNHPPGTAESASVHRLRSNPSMKWSSVLEPLIVKTSLTCFQTQAYAIYIPNDFNSFNFKSLLLEYYITQFASR